MSTFTVTFVAMLLLSFGSPSAHAGPVDGFASGKIEDLREMSLEESSDSGRRPQRGLGEPAPLGSSRSRKRRKSAEENEKLVRSLRSFSSPTELYDCEVGRPIHLALGSEHLFRLIEPVQNGKFVKIDVYKVLWTSVIVRYQSGICIEPTSFDLSRSLKVD